MGYGGMGTSSTELQSQKRRQETEPACPVGCVIGVQVDVEYCRLVAGLGSGAADKRKQSIG